MPAPVGPAMIITRGGRRHGSDGREAGTEEEAEADAAESRAEEEEEEEEGVLRGLLIRGANVSGDDDDDMTPPPRFAAARDENAESGARG